VQLIKASMDQGPYLPVGEEEVIVTDSFECASLSRGFSKMGPQVYYSAPFSPSYPTFS
jgi:hypothetical protein